MSVWNYRLFSVMGIPIRVNVTLLAFLPVIVWLIGSGVSDPEGAEIWADMLTSMSGHEVTAESLNTGNTPWLLGAFAAVGLFFGITVHELGHSYVALRYELPISSITLWIFGGMAQMEENPDDWRQEFWIAIAGPVTSVFVALGFYLLLSVVPAVPEVIFVVGWLAVMNVVLAVFNLIPAFPMDGGRVLRALLARNQPYARATATAANVAKVLAILMGVVGVLANPILVLIALFVYVAATSETRMTAISEALDGVSVRDLMTSDVDVVSPETSLEDLAERMMFERHTGYPVVDSAGDVVGIVTLSDLREVSPESRASTYVEDVMTSEVISVEPGDEAFDALMAIGRNNVGRVVVESDGVLEGIISRTDIMHALDVMQSGGYMPVARSA
ncbi:MAG: CBS domain-containing protein [Halobacteriales archaeon]